MNLTHEELITALEQAIDLAQIKLTPGIFKNTMQVESTLIDCWQSETMPELAKYLTQIKS